MTVSLLKGSKKPTNPSSLPRRSRMAVVYGYSRVGSRFHGIAQGWRDDLQAYAQDETPVRYADTGHAQNCWTMPRVTSATRSPNWTLPN